MGSSELNRPLRQMSLPATSAASSATPSTPTITITTTDSDQAVSGQLALWVEFVMPGFDKEEQWNKKKKDNLAVCAASILILFFIKLSITSPNTVECYVSGVR